MIPFSEVHVQDVLRGNTERIVSEIGELDTQYVLKASPTELEDHFIEKALVDPFVLRTDERTIGEQKGVDVDVRWDRDRAIMPGDSASVRGTQLRIDIPYEGDTALFQCIPSTFSFSGYPEIEIGNSHISFHVQFPDDRSGAAEAVKQEIERQTAALRQAAGILSSDVAAYNATVPAQIRSAIVARMQRARQTTNTVEALGIPLKHTDSAPAYAIPAKRRPSPRTLPPVSTKPYESEPFLHIDEYEYILGVVKSMGLVMERGPESFATMDEEMIRTHFLLQLNGHYEGGATGETFNAQGKTDILIRVKDRNVFIAECKFWRGQQEFERAIDQLLGYLSWRDSKCALLVFNTAKDSTAVTAKMHGAMMGRSECKKDLGPDQRGDRRYIFVKPSDPGREITITTQLFDVPHAVREGGKDR